MVRKRSWDCCGTFQGVAEAELEKNLERTFKIFFSSGSEQVRRRSAGSEVSPPRRDLNGIFWCVFRARVLVSARRESAPEVSGQRVRWVCERTVVPRQIWCLWSVQGGLLVGQPEDVPLSSMVTEADLQFYVSRYKDQGFR